MLANLYQKKREIHVDEIPHTVRMLSPYTSAKNGVLCRETTYRDISVANDYKGMSIFEFEVANIVNTGALQMLKDVSFTNHDVEGVSTQLDNISKSMENVES